MNLVHKKMQGKPSWEFVLTDVYKFKPGKIVHNLVLSHYQENEIQEGTNTNFAKIIVTYDCSKLVEIMVNVNSKEVNDDN
jgi:hypothetical protein